MPRAAISSLLAGVFLLMMSLGLLHTAIALRVEQTLGNPTIAGLVMSAYFAGLAIGSLRAASIIERVGHIRAFAAFSSGLAAATVAHIVVPEGLSWIALRLVQGVAMAGLFICVESWLNQVTDAKSRGSLLSLYMIAVYGGMGGGQLLLAAGSPGTGHLIAFSAILMSLAVVPIALMRSQSPSLPRVERFKLRRLYEISPLGVALTFVSGLVMGAIYGVAPIFAKAAGLSLREISIFMAALMLGGLALQFPIGRLSDRLDRRQVVALLLAALALVSLAMMPLIAGNAALLIIIGIALGGISFTLYPLAVAHINDFVGADMMVAASGGIILIYSAGAVVGPIVSGKLISMWGALGFLVYLCVVGLAAVGFCLRRILIAPPLPMEVQGPYVPVPRTTAIANTLDPRATESAEDAQEQAQ